MRSNADMVVAAKPVEIGGKPLDDEGFKHDEVASGGK